MIKRGLLVLSLTLIVLFLAGCTDDLITGRAKSGGTATAKPQCSNVKDDDGDGKCDYNGCKIKGLPYPKDPGCSGTLDNDEADPLPPSFDFSMSNGGDLNVLLVPGQRIINKIAVTTISGSPQRVTFTSSGAPLPTMASFNPYECQPPDEWGNPGTFVNGICAVDFSMYTDVNTRVGNYAVTATGTSGTKVRSTTFTLTLFNQTNQSTPPPTNQTNTTNMTGGGSGPINCWQQARGNGVYYPAIERIFRTSTVEECQENTRTIYTEYACQYDPIQSTYASTKTDIQQAWDTGLGDCCCKSGYSCVTCPTGRPPAPLGDDRLCGTRPDQGCTCTVMAWDGLQYSGQMTTTVWSELECKQWGDTQKSQVCGPGKINYNAMYYIYETGPPNGGNVGGGCCCTQPGDPTTCMACPSSSPSQACNDHLDNDGDGACDMLTSTCTDGSLPGDIGCMSTSDTDEIDLVIMCNDGYDNDRDGRCDTSGASCVDGSAPGDSDCSSITDNDEASSAINPPPPIERTFSCSGTGSMNDYIQYATPTGSQDPLEVCLYMARSRCISSCDQQGLAFNPTYCESTAGHGIYVDVWLNRGLLGCSATGPDSNGICTAADGQGTWRRRCDCCEY